MQLDSKTQLTLQRIANSPDVYTIRSIAMAKIILLVHQGWSQKDISDELLVPAKLVSIALANFQFLGLSCFEKKEGVAKAPTNKKITEDILADILAIASSPAPNAKKGWSSTAVHRALIALRGSVNFTATTVCSVLSRHKHLINADTNESRKNEIVDKLNTLGWIDEQRQKGSQQPKRPSKVPEDIKHMVIDLISTACPAGYTGWNFECLYREIERKMGALNFSPGTFKNYLHRNNITLESVGRKQGKISMEIRSKIDEIILQTSPDGCYLWKVKDLFLELSKQSGPLNFSLETLRQYLKRTQVQTFKYELQHLSTLESSITPEVHADIVTLIAEPPIGAPRWTVNKLYDAITLKRGRLNFSQEILRLYLIQNNMSVNLNGSRIEKSEYKRLHAEFGIYIKDIVKIGNERGLTFAATIEWLRSNGNAQMYYRSGGRRNGKLTKETIDQIMIILNEPARNGGAWTAKAVFEELRKRFASITVSMSRVVSYIYANNLLGSRSVDYLSTANYYNTGVSKSTFLRIQKHFKLNTEEAAKLIAASPGKGVAKEYDLYAKQLLEIADSPPPSGYNQWNTRLICRHLASNSGDPVLPFRPAWARKILKSKLTRESPKKRMIQFMQSGEYHTIRFNAARFPPPVAPIIYQLDLQLCRLKTDLIVEAATRKQRTSFYTRA